MPRGTFDHEYPAKQWTVAELATALRDHPEVYPLPTYADNEVWTSFVEDDLTAPLVTEICNRAATLTGANIPHLPASLYLDYHRTGNRTRYQEPFEERRTRLTLFTLAECFERTGAYLDDILNYAWAICEQSTWLLPAHLEHNERQDRDGLPGVVTDEDAYVSLRSAEIAQQLAELDYVLHDRLHATLRERIRHEVERRVLTAYEVREDFFWMEPPTNNWNPRCNVATAIAALHLLEDPDRQARILAKAISNIEYYLADFDPDGCTAEGIRYWNAGFGKYVQLAAHLHTRTAGRYSLLTPPIIDKIAEYPLKVELSRGRFIPFSDVTETAVVDPFTACWLGQHMDHPWLAARGRQELETEPSLDPFLDSKTIDVLRVLDQIRQVPRDWTTQPPPQRVHFSGYDWWISRAEPENPDGLVVAAKGGHNDESHNHNDLGSIVLHVGGESLLTDPGAAVYDAEYFTDRRYESIAARSFGHSVPYLNGTEQAAGAEYSATVLHRSDGGDADTFALDLSGAYPDEAGIEALERTLTLDRLANRLIVEDEATFTRAENDFVEVLVSYFPMEATDNGIEVRGDVGRATVDAEPSPTAVDIEHLEEAVRGNDVWRARLRYQADERIAVTLNATPR